MYFHIEGPAENSWLGFGIGEKMEASKMWVVYKNSAGTGELLLFLRAQRVGKLDKMSFEALEVYGKA